jgi:hypothetical protein
MSIACGHCKSRHATISDVRHCSVATRVAADIARDFAPQHEGTDPDYCHGHRHFSDAEAIGCGRAARLRGEAKATPVGTHIAVANASPAYYQGSLSEQVAGSLATAGVRADLLASPSQLRYVAGLLAERDVPATGGPFGKGFELASSGQPLLGSTASALISWMKGLPFAYNLPVERASYPQVSQGYYAVASATGNNDLDFFRVDRPTTGQYAGRAFVKRVIGGKADTPVRGQQARAALEAILAAGEREAAQRYGQEIGQCGRCNRHLTDELSRGRGIGPDCWSKL